MLRKEQKLLTFPEHPGHPLSLFVSRADQAQSSSRRMGERSFEPGVHLNLVSVGRLKELPMETPVIRSGAQAFLYASRYVTGFGSRGLVIVTFIVSVAPSGDSE